MNRDNIKPYNDLNSYLQDRFGCKVYKVALSGGMTCPNRDGTCGTRGCIFCSEGGSGDFAAPKSLAVSEQIEYGISLLQKKLAGKSAECKYIAYFQSYTNTYAKTEYLRRIYTEAVSNNSICALSIATRPDCLPDEVIELIKEINRIKPVIVELGLQTIHVSTAEFIRRGYRSEVFESALRKLNEAGIETVVHMIIGLPGETPEMILKTAEYLGHIGRDKQTVFETAEVQTGSCKDGKTDTETRYGVSGIKLQLLHIMSGTDLGTIYLEDESLKKKLYVNTPKEYIELLIKILEILPKDMVIHRLTGDAPHDKLLYPMWSANKRTTLNGILKEMRTRETYQGRLYKGN